LARKVHFIIGLGCLAAVLLVMAVSLGAVRVPVGEATKALLGLETDTRFRIIIHGIRLPHALAAQLAGSRLAAAEAAMQSILRNPLGSPFTLGLSQAGALRSGMEDGL
jgi:iron complex transport system permease protein